MIKGLSIGGRGIIMATLIKETPVLTGKDAEAFLEEMKKSEIVKASEKELAEMKKAFEMISKIATFS